LAISPDLRGANMGSRVLEAFCRKAGRIVLEIDPPETEIAVRRLRFYERLGFVRNDYHYVHPSFQRPYEPHQLVLMSYPKAMTDEECRSFERFVRDPVLRYSCHGKKE
jgi:GNAT superfamily N-acetyltransferase